MDIVIREAKELDCEALYNIRQMPGVMENILSNRDERIDRLMHHIKNRQPCDYWFVAEYLDQVVGLITLKGSMNPRKSHSGYVTMMVDGHYHGKGIGSALLKHLIKFAFNQLNLVRLELSVFTENIRAFNLYKKFGFKVEGLQRKTAVRNDKLSDEFMMAKINE